MFANPTSVETVQAEWQGVIRMRDRMRRLVSSTFALSAKNTPAFGDVLYNLPLVMAFDVLKHVLLQAKDEGWLAEDSERQLTDLMDSAKTAMPWNDWMCLREGVDRRNKVLHNGKLYGDIQCLHYIADIEAQLLSWGIITPAQSCLPEYACPSPHK